MTDRASADRFPVRSLVVLLAAATVLRIGTSLSRVDEVPAEGLYRGTLAKAFVDGLTLWPTHLYEIPHVPGSLLVSVLASPFYVLLGPSTFALRFAGTLFHLAALALWMVVVHRNFGSRAARLSGALFAFAPAGFAKMAILSYGDHVESLPFVLAAALFTIEWARGEGSRLLAKAFFAGALVTLAVGFHLQGALGIAALSLVAVPVALPRVREPRFWGELAVGFLPGMVAGAALPFLGWLVTGGASITLWGRSPTQHLGATDPVDRFVTLWRDGFPFAFQFENRFLADGTLLLAYGCALALFVGAILRWRRGETSLRSILACGGFFAAYPILFSLVFARSSNSFVIEDSTSNALEVRYALPLIPFLLLPIGVAAARLADRGRPVLAPMVFGPAFLLGAFGSFSTWDWRTILHEPARRGFHWEEFNGHFLYASLSAEDRAGLRRVESKLLGDPERNTTANRFVASHADPGAVLDLVHAVDDADAWTFPLRYIPPRIPLGAPPSGDAGARLAWIRRPPPRFRAFAAAAVGHDLGMAEPFDRELAAQLLGGPASEEERLWLARGLGHGLLQVSLDGYPPVPRFFDGKKAFARIDSLPERVDRNEVAFGLGFRVGKIVNEFFSPSAALLRRAVANFPPQLARSFTRGLGAGYRLRFLVPPSSDVVSPAVDRLLEGIPDALHPQFREGLGGATSAR